MLPLQLYIMLFTIDRPKSGDPNLADEFPFIDSLHSLTSHNSGQLAKCLICEAEVNAIL